MFPGFCHRSDLQYVLGTDGETGHSLAGFMLLMTHTHIGGGAVEVMIGH